MDVPGTKFPQSRPFSFVSLLEKSVAILLKVEISYPKSMNILLLFSMMSSKSIQIWNCHGWIGTIGP